MAAAKEKEGIEGEWERLTVSRETDLDPLETQVLDETTFTALQEVERLDRQAKEIIAHIRRQTPGGKLLPGQLPPAVPKDLQLLQSMRDRIFLDSRDRLKQSFGTERFGAFDSVVREKIRKKVQFVTPN